MIHTHNHESLDTPPNKSFFGKKRSGDVGISPGKRISLLTKCMDQLDKWYQLKECGVISSMRNFRKQFLWTSRSFETSNNQSKLP